MSQVFKPGQRIWKGTVEPMECDLGRREAVGVVRFTATTEQPVGIFDVCDVRRWDAMKPVQQRWAMLILRWLHDKKFKVHCFKSWGQWGLPH